MSDADNEDTQRGKIIAVRGNVVDVRFNPPLPPRNQQLRAGPDERKVRAALARLEAGALRGFRELQEETRG